MRCYNILQPVWLAFFSKPLYRDVRQSWQGLAFGYLFLLVAICCLPLTFRLHVKINHMVLHLQPWFKQIPTFTIHNETISIDQPVPYYIKNPDNGNVFAIIDTSGSITSLEKSGAQVLITNKQVILKKNADTYKAYNLTGIRDHIFTADDADTLIKKVGNLLIFFIYPMLVAFYFIIAMLEALIYSALAKLFIKTQLPYSIVFRLALVAITPKIILTTLLGVFGIMIPYKWVWYFAVGMGYLFFAVEANRQNSV